MSHLPQLCRGLSASTLKIDVLGLLANASTKGVDARLYNLQRVCLNNGAQAAARAERCSMRSFEGMEISNLVLQHSPDQSLVVW